MRNRRTGVVTTYTDVGGKVLAHLLCVKDLPVVCGQDGCNGQMRIASLEPVPYSNPQRILVQCDRCEIRGTVYAEYQRGVVSNG